MHWHPRYGILLAALIALLGALVMSLAIPLPVWRTGRLEAPPLELTSGGPLVPQSGRIWIDTDAACGATRNTDPDDCLAIIWLITKGYKIAGISTSYGNASGDVVGRTVEALVAELQKSGLSPVPVWRGSIGPLLATDETILPAHMALRAELERGPLTVLALGPLTNVAAALDGQPELQHNLTRLVAVMGHRPGHIFHPSEGSGRGGMLMGHGPIFRDLNFAMDEGAVRSILEMHLPLTLIPYDAARHVTITADDLDRLNESGPGFAWVAGTARGWLAYWRVDIGQPGFYPFDWIAAAYVVDPQLFDCAVAHARIADEWAFWLYPRASLLISPISLRDAGAKSEVIYCPQVDPSLHGYLLADDKKLHQLGTSLTD